MPAPARSRTTWVISSRVWPTQVRWAIGTIEVSTAILRVIPMVRSRVVPPAPYVTDTKVGLSCSSERSASHSPTVPASSLGGKNSKEYDGPRPISSGTRGPGLTATRGGVASPEVSMSGDVTGQGYARAVTAEPWDDARFRADVQDVLDA